VPFHFLLRIHAGRYMKIHVDDRPVTSSAFDGQGEDRFVYVEYELPVELLKGKERVTVKLQAGVAIARAADL
jgi:hypothetical protein